MKNYSQKGQDEWVINEIFQGKQNGYFLDLAAADGINLSNTYLLERGYHWDGICIEPNPVFYGQLQKSRNCLCVEQCIDEGDGVVDFVLMDELGGIIDDDTDNNPALRENQLEQAHTEGRIITLNTVPLADLLEELDAPNTIDYFSFDVEGSETRILRQFPFDKYRFLAMTIERPTPELNKLLFRNGYISVRNSMFDTFYVHETLPNLFQIEKGAFEQIPSKDW